MNTNLQKGYITLIAVIVVGALATAVGIAFLSRGITSSKNTISLEASIRAHINADTCAERALEQIRTATSDINPGRITFDDGSCSYTIRDNGGAGRTISAMGISGTGIQKISVEIEGLNPFITVSSWSAVE